MLVRLAHLFEAAGGVGWDLELSAPAAVDLRQLFPNRAIAALEETTLSGSPLALARGGFGKKGGRLSQPTTTGGGGGGSGGSGVGGARGEKL